MSSRIFWSDRLRNRESTGEIGVCGPRSCCVREPSITGGRMPEFAGEMFEQDLLFGIGQPVHGGFDFD
jgi:hypothetical protein